MAFDEDPGPFSPVGLLGFLVEHGVDFIIRSKEAANREKDRVVLPALRRLLERSSEDRSSPADQRY